MQSPTGTSEAFLMRSLSPNNMALGNLGLHEIGGVSKENEIDDLVLEKQS